ncbi:hypothetical protein, partial [Legionella sp. S2E2]|uniref:hypothetical protein n=1 Tax=Legionella sp. S2E2 TaxID=3402815 RepID=UPI003AF502C5
MLRKIRQLLASLSPTLSREKHPHTIPIPYAGEGVKRYSRTKENSPVIVSPLPNPLPRKAPSYYSNSLRGRGSLREAFM